MNRFKVHVKYKGGQIVDKKKKTVLLCIKILQMSTPLLIKRTLQQSHTEDTLVLPLVDDVKNTSKFWIVSFTSLFSLSVQKQHTHRSEAPFRQRFHFYLSV